MDFNAAYKTLNDEQRRAVDTIDGPLLVLAGPGTGKTQLLGARVANILRKTDTLPQNILCLTFTDAAAQNMRERLNGMIGERAYDVHINTYHGFASDIIRTYPEFFETVNIETGEDSRMTRPIDELRQLDIISTIVNSLAYDDALYNAKYYAKSILGAISDFKQAALAPDQVQDIANTTLSLLLRLNPKIQDVMKDTARMPRKVDQASDLFEEIKNTLETEPSFMTALAIKDLDNAIIEAGEDNSTKLLTAWKNKWLYKDDAYKWTFTNQSQIEKLISLSRIYAQYQSVLHKTGEYDFNDMIIRTIEVLKYSSELKFNLQEKYQYILLDEFQDTNLAQFQLVKELVDHPVHENRPNVMAVGDDDQGIFAFQGADIGNMVEFIRTFQDVEVINLTKNYRSHHDILHVAHNIAGQIESRLHHSLESIDKNIQAAGDKLPKDAIIARHEFESQANESGWIAEKISELIKNGVRPSQIAVLAPKHKILEELVSFLNNKSIPVTYEKRENIFDTEIIQSLLILSECIMAGSSGNFEQLDETLPKVLSLPFWGIKTQDIWALNWEYSGLKNKKEPKSYFECALDRPATGKQTSFILKLCSINAVTSLEQMLDYFTGAKSILLDDNTEMYSPLKDYYFSEVIQKEQPLAFYETLSHLSVIRSQLRDQQTQSDAMLHIDQLVRLYNLYEEAQQPLINTHPIAQSSESVQLQTVYKAKGLEYDYVFLPAMHDDVWGSAGSTGNNRITLPENLRHIRHDSSDEDTKRRLLFVAITRAKHGLYLTSYAKKENGKRTIPPKYLQEIQAIDGKRTSSLLPYKFQAVIETERSDSQTNIDIETHWFSRHTNLTPSLRSLLSQRITSYKMSPTHLNSFTNLEYAGPQAFLMGALLRFPEAASPESLYGSALHGALEWFQKQGLSNPNEWPEDKQVLSRFAKNMKFSHLVDSERDELIKRGKEALNIFLEANRKNIKDKYALAEVDFSREGVVIEGALLTGKIDRLEIDKKSKTVRIIDFKSGGAATKWESSSKLLSYKQQLYFYILLIEKSHSYSEYKVEAAELQFIEPLNGKYVNPLKLDYKQQEYDDFKRLIVSVWQHIQELSLPDTSEYPTTVAGSKKFIEKLQNKKRPS